MSDDPEQRPDRAPTTENTASVLPAQPLGSDSNLPESRRAPARIHLGLTADRRAKFLAALRECGNAAEAVRRASNGRCSKKTFYDARHRDPEFAAAWEEAMAVALGKIEAALFERATKGMVVRQKFAEDGRLFAEDRVFSDNAGIAILRVRDAAWRDALARRDVDVTARADVVSRVRVESPKPPDVSSLSDEELRELERLASKVR